MRVFTDLTQLPSFRDTVVTIGSFDGVHTGHRRILEQVRNLARTEGCESIVLSFEPHPRSVLQPDDSSFKLLTTSAEKIALLSQCGIDHVVLAPFTAGFARQSAETYVEQFLIKNFRPKFLVIGYDHRFGAGREGGIEFLRRYEARGDFAIVEIPAQEVDDIAVSSSKIRKALENSDIAHANRLLAHPFFLTGQVVEGQRIGRSIGFPTANLRIDDRHKLLPPPGIYAARAHVPQPPGSAAPFRACDAMLYLGDRPTLGVDNPVSIEVNLLNFDGDLYGRTLRVDVLDFIRPDRKLDGLDELKTQIEADKREIQTRLGTEKPAVVILNYNTRRHLQENLPSVLRYSPGARIIVADNGSPDDSIAFLREHYPQVEVLDLQRNHGFAQGYNEALQYVSGDLYILLNSDVEVTEGWMNAPLRLLRERPEVAVVQPKILAQQNKARFEYAGAAGGWIDYLGYPFCRGRIFSQNEEDHGQYDTPQECFWASGAAFFVRADCYHRLGGFDGDYFAHNEEIDLCWRLKRAGYGVWCLPESVAYHLGGGTLEYESPRKVFVNFRNSLFTLLKNAPAGRLLWLIPARLLLDGLAGARFVAKGQFRAVWAIVRAHFSFYRFFGKMLRKRRFLLKHLEKHRIGPENTAGLYRRSIVFDHYARRIKRFSKLF